MDPTWPNVLLFLITSVVVKTAGSSLKAPVQLLHSEEEWGASTSVGRRRGEEEKTERAREREREEKALHEMPSTLLVGPLHDNAP